MTTKADADIRRRETADWFARLNQRRVTAADVKAFSDWRREPENAAAFDRMQAMWDAAGTLAEDPAMAALSDAARSRGRSDRRRGVRRLVGLAPIGAAGVLACVVATGWWIWSIQQPQTYGAAVGERRTVALADGSRITLDTESRVEVRLTDARRAVTLVAGQARFDVQGDAARPFVVKAGGTEVTATGTRFDVRRFGAGARVVLVDGRVAVQDDRTPGKRWTLAPGQQIVTTSTEPAVAASDLVAATSWTTGRLTFRETPVSVAVAEINRYNRHRIEVRDPRVSSARVSGVFDADDAEGFVAALQDLYTLQAERFADGRIVLTGPAEK